jgi:hypothetical protein
MLLHVCTHSLAPNIDAFFMPDSLRERLGHFAAFYCSQTLERNTIFPPTMVLKNIMLAYTGTEPLCTSGCGAYSGVLLSWRPGEPC